jgi:Tfp pilus assembly protein PilV
LIAVLMLSIGLLGMASSMGKTAAQVQQNFANWFSYYRSREFVAKAALSN